MKDMSGLKECSRGKHVIPAGYNAVRRVECQRCEKILYRRYRGHDRVDQFTYWTTEDKDKAIAAKKREAAALARKKKGRGSRGRRRLTRLPRGKRVSARSSSRRRR